MPSDVRACSIARTLEVVGEKWTLLAVREMLLGNHRFDEFIRYTGAPRDILTNRLRKLEDAGLVHRTRYQDRPPRFEYHLTEAGQALRPIIATLRTWGDQYVASPSRPPMVFTHTCGATYHAALACRACGEIVERGSVRLVPDADRDPGPAAGR